MGENDADIDVAGDMEDDSKIGEVVRVLGQHFIHLNLNTHETSL